MSMIKKISIVALLLIVIGVIGSIATFATTTKKSAAITTEIDDISFTSIQIDVTNTDIELIPVQEQAKIEVVGRNAEKTNEQITIDRQGETLTIKTEKQKRKWISFGFNPSPKIKVFIPEKEYESIHVTATTADTYVQKLAGKNIKLTTTTGDIVAKNITSNELAVKVTTGDILLDEVKGDTSAEARTGDVVLTNIDGSMVNAKTTTGDILLRKVLGDIQAKTRTGDLTLQNDEIKGSMTGETTTGDIFVQAKNFPEDIQFNTATRNGDILIFGQKKQFINNSDSGILFQLETTTGDIIVKKK